MDGHGNGKSHGHSVDPTNQELSHLNKIAAEGEKLVAKMDSNHRGFVTPDELFKASKDTHLTAAERKTAGELYKLQEEIRYNRLGVLPSLEVPPHGSDTVSQLGRAAGDAGKALSQGAKAQKLGAETVGEAAGSLLGAAGGGSLAGAALAMAGREVLDSISVRDVKGFHQDVNNAITGKDIKRLGGEAVARDIMAKYGEHGQLDQAQTQKALAALHGKKSLTSMERDEVNVLEAVRRHQLVSAAMAAAMSINDARGSGAAQEKAKIVDSGTLAKIANSQADRELHNRAVVEATHVLKQPATARGSDATERGSDATLHSGAVRDSHGQTPAKHAPGALAPAAPTYVVPRPAY